MNVVLRVSTFDCPGLGAWKPVLAVARKAMASLTSKRACSLPTVVEPNEE